MTNFQTRITTAIATGAVLLSSVAPVFASDTIVITGNGKNSDNNVGVSQTNTTTVSQTNTAVINNNTVVNSNSGGNKASDNLGDVNVKTGASNTNVTVQNNANSNVASLGGCSTCNSGAQVLVSDNLKGSTNNVGVSQNNATVLFQTNAADVNNNTTINSNTGDNKTNDNLGNVHVTTGESNANVTAKTAVNTNSANVGGGVGAAGGANSGVSAYITGNGKNTDNNIGLSLSNATVINQVNSAEVANNTTINANTGKNKANDNLGDVSVATGGTNANVNVDTMANFNAAAITDCGCADIFAKIGKNLKNSNNNIGLDLSNGREVFQTSGAAVTNNTVDNGNSGNNQLNDNGSSYLNDPHLTTGPSSSNVTAHTSANSNVVGPSVSLPGNTQMTFSWDMNMASLWSWMMMHM